MLFAALAALALVGSSLLGAPAARADQVDYISYLDDNGVSYRTMAGVVAVGKDSVCHPLRDGGTVDAVIGRLVDDGYTGEETATIIIGAIRYLCPDQTPVLQDWRARHNAMI